MMMTMMICPNERRQCELGWPACTETTHSYCMQTTSLKPILIAATSEPSNLSLWMPLSFSFLGVGGWVWDPAWRCYGESVSTIKMARQVWMASKYADNQLVTITNFSVIMHPCCKSTVQARAGMNWFWGLILYFSEFRWQPLHPVWWFFFCFLCFCLWNRICQFLSFDHDIIIVSVFVILFLFQGLFEKVQKSEGLIFPF